jgi:hypothetical protein
MIVLLAIFGIYYWVFESPQMYKLLCINDINYFTNNTMR